MDKQPTITFPTSKEQRDEFKRRAASLHLSLSDYMRRVCEDWLANDRRITLEEK